MMVKWAVEMRKRGLTMRRGALQLDGKVGTVGFEVANGLGIIYDFP